MRYFNPIGGHPSIEIGELPKGKPQNLVPFITQTAAGIHNNLNVFGNDYPTLDGTCIRDYIHVSDLTDIHLKSLEYLNNKKKSFTLNCGYGKGYSVKEIVNIFKKIKKRKIIKYSKKRPGDVAKVYANNNKIKKLFGWKPKNDDIQQIIYSAIRWEKKI